MEPNDWIGAWVVLRKLGGGGMGHVYLCRHRDDPARRAAVKVMVEGATEADLARFSREADILASLDHPAICRLVDHSDEPPYIAMEVVEGTPLDVYIRDRGALPVPEATEIARQVAETLLFLHAAGIAHRDVKPANLILDGGRWIRFVDFGIAIDESRERLTQAGEVFGSLAYLPPELLKGETPDGPTRDLFAAGVTLYVMLTGADPLSGVDPKSPRYQDRAVQARRAMGPLDPGARTPEPLRSLVRRMTEPEPDQRIRLPEVVRELQRMGRAPLPAPLGRTGAVAGLAGLSGVAMGATAAAVVGLALAATAYVATRPPPATHRDVRIRVTGLSASTPVFVAMDGERPVWREDGAQVFDDLPVGRHQLEVVAGARCDGICPGEDCDVCCASASRTLDLDGEDATAEVSVALQLPEAPPARAVAIRADAPGLPAWPVTLEVRQGGESFGASGTDAPAWSHRALRPGLYDVRVAVGSCAPEHEDCASAENCPPGCYADTRLVEVPCGRGEASFVLPVALPTPVKGGASGARAAGEASGSPTVTPARAAPRQVTNGELWVWIQRQPKYAPGPARSAGLADGRYLKPWSRTGPTDTLALEPAGWVSAGVADAYCRDVGRGLAQVTDPPTTWEGQLDGEIRRDGSTHRVLSRTGVVSRVESEAWTHGSIGARCSF